jgi:hypothetical protein
MPTPTAHAYAGFVNAAFIAGVDVTGHTFSAVLLATTYTPDVDTHATHADIAAHEIVGTGYDEFGQTLTGVGWAYTAGTNTWTLTCDGPIEWATTTLTDVRYLVITDASSFIGNVLVSYMDLGADTSTVAQPFAVTVPASGLVSVTVT